MRRLIFIFIAIMALNYKILPQSSFGLSGYWGIPETITIPFYNFESNRSNYFGIKDWGISLQYGAEFANKTLTTGVSETEINTNLYAISLAKKLSNHSLSARFTPGYQKEFLFATGESIVVNDTISQSLEANYTYKELFGLGYAYKFNEQFNAGLTVRFFNQDFNQQILIPVFGDTIYLVRETIDETITRWNLDFGADFILNEQFKFRAASINLFTFEDEIANEEFVGFELQNERSALLSASYLPTDFINIHLLYETSGSMQVSATGQTAQFVYGLTAFHDYYQEPYFAGVLPAFGYKTNLFEILLTGVKYFSSRNSNASYSQFSQEGFYNIINNRYSFNKIVLSLALNISSTPEQRVELIDVEIVRDIYPTFYDKYIDQPFAYGRAVNISDETISVIPSVKIEGVTDDRIQSPQQMILPGDTARIPFYIIIPENYQVDKAVLSYADFFVTVSAAEMTNQIQKPALINGINSWDGNVVNLRYFIMRNVEFSMSYSKDILSRNKSTLDTIPKILSEFYKSKILFNHFVSGLVYTSDPRATAEYVQFPEQTLELRGGDCDDLSVAYSSLLESIGIQTALVDYKQTDDVRHVNVLFNTKLSPAQAKLITDNDSKYFIRKNEQDKDEVWIPVEATSLTDFDRAWNIGVEKFNREAIEQLGLAKGKVEIVDVY